MKIKFKEYTDTTKLKDGIYLIVNEQEDFELTYIFDGFMSDYPSSRASMPVDADYIKKYVRIEQ